MLLVAAVKIKMARWDFPCLRWAPTWVTFHVDVPIWWYWLWRLLRAWLFPSNQDIGHHDPWWSKVLIGVDGSSSVLSGFMMQESSMKIRCIRQCQHLTNVCHHEHQSDRAVVTLQTKSEDLLYLILPYILPCRLTVQAVLFETKYAILINLAVGSLFCSVCYAEIVRLKQLN